MLVFRANQFATYSGRSQAPDDIDSGAPPIKLQFLLRLNRNGLIGWWAHNAGWHMESVTVGLLNSKSWLLFIRRFLRESAVRIKDSAAHMERSTARVEDSADRRTELAADRTVFAAERTYAAWVRTGLVAMASGIGAKALLTDLLPHWLVMASGSAFVLFSAFCFGAGVWRHLYPGPPPPVPDASRIHPAILVFVNGILALVSIAALVGIWLSPS